MIADKIKIKGKHVDQSETQESCPLNINFKRNSEIFQDPHN